MNVFFLQPGQRIILNNHDITRQNIARYCANILYGSHIRKEAVSARIGHTLACIPFFSEEDRINLASWTCEFLAPMLKETHILLDVTVTPEGEDYLRVNGEIIRR
jgi:hypothetical protein